MVAFSRELLAQLLWHWLETAKYLELWKVPGLSGCLSGQLGFYNSDRAGEDAGVRFPGDTVLAKRAGGVTDTEQRDRRTPSPFSTRAGWDPLSETCPVPWEGPLLTSLSFPQLDIQLQMQMEQMLIEEHALEQQKALASGPLEDTAFDQRARQRLLKLVGTPRPCL